MSVYQTIEHKGKTVRYFDIGRGDIVLFIHGFCLTSETCEAMVPTLLNRCRLIGIDLPGFGGTEFVPELTTLSKTAAWLREVVDVLGLTEFTLVGHSMGGYLGLAFVEQFPEYVKGLGMIHSQAVADRPFKKEDRDRTAELIKQYGIRQFVPKWMPDLFHLQRQESKERVLELSLRTSEEGALNALNMMRDREDRSELLNGLEIPVTFVIGRHDRIIDYADLRYKLMDAPTSKGVILESSGHMAMYEEPEACADALLHLLGATEK